MKKQLSLAALAALGVLTCSCIHEREFVQYEPEPEAISFVLGGLSTRSEADPQVRVNRYSLGSDEHGNLFTLEETVAWLDDIGDSPATRGTPAYSENLQQVHGSGFNGRAYNATSGALVIEDGTFFAMEDGVRWRRAFGFDPWPAEDELTFFINMPAEAPGLTITGYDTANGTISFNYQTPETAEQQQDILFAKTTLDGDTYMEAYENHGGPSILLRHALTGIKFAVANDINDTDEETGTYPENKVETFITKVEFLGLVSKGSAVYHQDDSNESSLTGDRPIDVHSSKTSFTWTPDETSRDAVFYQEFTEDNIITFLNPYAQPQPGEGEGEGGEGEEGGGGEGEIEDKVHAAESFYLAGNQRNLNDETASLTFWFIPQEMTADVKVRVTFYVWDGQNAGEEVTRVLNLGQEILNQQSTSSLNLDWKAGQIRTFKLSPTSIDVDLTVEPDPDLENTIGTPEIRNIGNKDAYIRAAIVGNWVDYEGNIVLGTVITSTNETTQVTTTTHTPLTPWAEDNTTFGTFTNLGAGGAWVKESDGYWYYTQAVPAGKRPGETAAGGTYVPLFEAYTKGTPPDEDLTLMLDVAVQAVDAKAGGTYAEAWRSVGALPVI